MRGVLLRSFAVFAVGLAALAAILYYASAVDGRPPQVVRIGLTHHLSSDATAALTTTSIEVEFSEPVEPASGEAALRIDPTLEGSFSWAGRTLTFTPSDRLPLETGFTVQVLPGVRDRAGNAMDEEPEPFAFETVGHPTVVRSQPENRAQDVPLESSIVLEFSTLMDTASVEAALRIQPAVELEVTWSGEQLTLTPSTAFMEGRQYTLRIGTTARDGAGTPLERTFRLAFRAARSGLEAVTLVPSAGIEGVVVTSPISIVFDRALDPESLDDGQLILTPAVPGSLDVVAPPGAEGLRDPTPRVLRFQPSAPLEPNTTYEVSLAAGLLGADGSQLATPLAWRFTTGAPLASLGNQIVFLTDRSGIANLWSMNPDGTGQRQLSAELSPVTSYAVAPDGRSFVIGDGAVLIRLGADGGARQVLTSVGNLEFDPTYAPDGSELAFGRADAETGAGLGLWTRAAGGGGDARRIQLPDELRPGATPTPSPSSGAPPPAPVLRAPRYSPDGAALAFVDLSGRVGVLELPAGRLTTAQFGAVSPPAWLADSTALLLSGLDPGALDEPAAGEPLPALDPATLGLSDDQLGSLDVARLDRGATTAVRLAHSDGASRPATSGDGRYLYIVVQPEFPGAAGVLRLTSRGGGTTFPVLRDGGAAVTSAAFGPEPGAVVGARVDDGIWLVDVTSGSGEQLAADGWQPRWLP
ncbi:MAG TPA: Ig-like domain-containing protein [Candidatus Limnocylindria bacterium]